MLDTINYWDGQVLIKFQELAIRPELTPVMKILSWLGNKGMIWILLILVLLCFKKTRHAAVLAAVALALSYCLNNLFLKELVDRTRPYETWNQVQLLIGKQHDPSFPSGHTASSFAVATSLALSFQRRWAGTLLIILAAAIAISRMYVGVHYPLDVLCGMVDAILISHVVNYVDREHQEELRPSKHYNHQEGKYNGSHRESMGPAAGSGI